MYKALNKIILRTPLISYDNLNKLSNISYIKAKEILKSEFTNSLYKEAIYLASPVLYDRLIKWLDGEITNEKDERKLVYSLTKYYSRMCARPTPFGLFAGVSCINNLYIETDLNLRVIISNEESYKTSTRLDMQYLCNIAYELVKKDHIKKYFKYYINNSLYNIGNSIRYIEWKFVNNRKSFSVMSIDSSEHLQTVISIAKNGVTIEELNLELLRTDNSLNKIEVLNFINELIDSQILVTDIEPTVSGEDYINIILNRITQIPELDYYSSSLTEVKKLISELDSETIGRNVLKYKAIVEILKELEVNIDLGMLFQSDLFKPVDNSNIPKNLCEELNSTINFLVKLKSRTENFNIRNFKSDFQSRYETMEVPFLEALDTDFGIGYKIKAEDADYNPLLKGIAINNSINNNTFQIDSKEQIIINKYFEAIKNNDMEVNLNEADFIEFINKNEPIVPPHTLSTLISVINWDDDEKLAVLHAFGGSSAANLLGRFCHLDENIKNLVTEITNIEKENFKSFIVAEIAHLPESRIGNILYRPHIREFEIPYLCHSQLDCDHKIELEDLMISLVNDKITLRSKKLNKFIIPRLSTAHNYSFNSLPAYQFLCDLQFQYFTSGLGIGFGGVLSEMEFTPRIRHNNILLSLARWKLKKELFDKLYMLDEELLVQEVRKIRERINLPAFVSLVDGDNELYIDLESNLFILTFLDAIKKRTTIELVEIINNPSKKIIKDNKGSFANQFIIPYKLEGSKLDLNYNFNFDNSLIKRNFLPGEEWLYFKIYTGNKLANDFLIFVLTDLIDEFINKNIISKWFYIRYADPKEHLRIRLRLIDINNYDYINKRLSLVFSDLMSHKYIWKYQQDTYTRELERYGSNAIDICENIFYHDSTCTLNILSNLEGDLGENKLWKIALLSIDQYLTCLNLSINEKINFIEMLKDDFNKEFNNDKHVSIQLDQKYRSNKKEIYNVINFKIDEYHIFNSIIEKRNFDIKTCFNELIIKIGEQETYNIVPSILHMSINRMFKSKQRLHEMIIYNLLFEYYRSALAIEKSNKNTSK